MFYLNNTRQLDDPFLGLTNDSVGVPNPATFYDRQQRDDAAGPLHRRARRHHGAFLVRRTERLVQQAPAAHLDDRRHVQLEPASHALRIGGEFRRNEFDTNLPEEQATEFEKFDNFTQLLRGLATEADTQFGITDKQFRFNDFNMFLADDWRLSPKLTLNAGVRYEFFGLPEEVNGRIGNVDFDALTNTENPVNAFIVPEERAEHRLRGHRLGHRHVGEGGEQPHVERPGLEQRRAAAWVRLDAGDSDEVVVRGGYGVFFDRPSAAFINTVFSNYPFLREQEVTFPASAVPMNAAWSQQDPNFPFNQYLPNRIVRTAGATGTYQIRDGTNVTRGADGTLNPVDPATGLPTRAISPRRSSSAPSTATCARHTCSSTTSASSASWREPDARGALRRQQGHQAARGAAFNQGYDLNASDTPDHIFERFNQAYVAAGSPNGALNAGTTARARGVGRAFGFPNTSLGGMVDYNLANAGGAVIGFEARTPVLGFNIPEAVLLEQHRPLALQLAAAEPGEADVARHAVQPRLHLLAVEGYELGRPRQHRRRRQARRAQRRFRRSRAISAISTRTTRCRTSIGRTEFSGSFVWELPGGVLGGVPFLRLRPAAVRLAVLDLLGRARTGETSAVRRSRPRIGGIYRLASAGRACAARSTSFASTATIPRRRRSTRVCCAHQRRPPAAIRTTWASAISGATCCGFLAASRGPQCRQGDLARRRAKVRTAVGRVQRPQHRELRASEHGHRGRDHRLRKDHRFGRRSSGDAVGCPSEILGATRMAPAGIAGAITPSSPSFRTTLVSQSLRSRQGAVTCAGYAAEALCVPKKHAAIRRKR